MAWKLTQLKKLQRSAVPRKTDASGSPAQRDLERPTAHEIFVEVARNGRQELERDVSNLAISGLAGGLVMGLTGLGPAIGIAELGDSGAAHFIANMMYPIGFIAVILGRAQLFTENTLYPVALVLTERRHVLRTLRLWLIVLVSNCAGAFGFSLLTVRTGALMPRYVDTLAKLGAEIAHRPTGQIFWSAVVGGWIIALVAWLVSGSHSISGSVLLIWLLTFLVGLGHFAHSIASSGEVLAAVLAHSLPAVSYFQWLCPAVLGNICGGVLLVTLLEYGQIKAE